MQSDFGYFEEDKLGKPYDIKLLRRLYPFSHPYRHLLFFSVILVVFITLMDLAIPYVTKIAIDRYIVPAFENKNPGSGLSQKDSKIEESSDRIYRADLSDPVISDMVEK